MLIETIYSRLCMRKDMNSLSNTVTCFFVRNTSIRNRAILTKIIRNIEGYPLESKNIKTSFLRECTKVIFKISQNFLLMHMEVPLVIIFRKKIALGSGLPWLRYNQRFKIWPKWPKMKRKYPPRSIFRHSYGREQLWMSYFYVLWYLR